MNPFMAFMILFIYEILQVGASTDYLLFTQKRSATKRQRKPGNIKRQKIGTILYFLIAFLSPFLDLLWIDFIFRKISFIGPFIHYELGLLLLISMLPTLLFSKLSYMLCSLTE